ncbi:MAG TPA: flagellar assembly peptidoglycan hydrolase FlgJ [Caldimonas sp.]|jgi:flagellar protein FlgJ|nr:flagellar assembly peptidoglycan hydrolase FlgJ [Caldimonas sp.]HEX2539825.1 flagellar assembly peptidoglycan hydrolase FlgJ [Caldimonas sp.]
MAAPLASASAASAAGLPSSASSALAIGDLRSAAARDPKAAVKEVAKQFEALFMQQLMKSMREATMHSGMLDNSGTQLSTELLDTQYATKLTGLPGGLADAIARQLERQMGPGAAAAFAAPPPTDGAAADAPAGAAMPLSPKQSDFVRSHQESARQAEAASGIPAAFMVAQAAHESGWGRREIRHADGSSSHNLFGIKAGPGWTGPVAEITTTEYVHGEAQKVTAKFRAYASYDESFRDYARLMKESPRYATVVAQASQATASAASARDFAQGLQRAGYATDPAYADKLARVINTTLRMQRVVS